MALGVADLVVTALLNGGIHAAGLWYLCLIPITVAHMRNPRQTLLWSAVSVGAVCVVAAVDPVWPFARDLPVETMDVVVSMRILLLAATCAFAIASAKAMGRHIAAIEEGEHRLKEQAWQLALARNEADAARLKAEAISRELAAAKDAAEAANRAKERVRRQHEPRDSHADERHHRHDRSRARHRARPASSASTCRWPSASADALLTVINDMLDFSKIEAGKLDLDAVDFDLRDDLGDTMRALALRAHLKGLELAYEVRPEVPDVIVADPPPAAADPDQPRRQCDQIHRAGRGVVEVRNAERGMVNDAADSALPTAVRSALDLHFAVRDTGIGIAAEKQQAIFDAFEQADGSTTRKYGGTGLGLTISRRLVEMMGGRIWVESEAKRGSTFHFTVRCAPSSRVSARQPVPLDRLRDVLVLVVDDNATNRRILKEMLTRWQMRPTTVDGGAAALGCYDARGRPRARRSHWC